MDNKTETTKDAKLTKFPDAEKANQEMHPTSKLPSAFDLFKPSIAAIQNNLVSFLVLIGIPLVLTLVGQGPHLFNGGSNVLTGSGSNNPMGVFALIGGLLSLLAAPGAIVLQLKATRKEAVTWEEAFKEGLSQFWRFLGLAIVTGLLLLVSLVAFIVPFFIVLPRIILAPYYLIDRKLGIIESLKASAADYKSYKGIWGLVGVYVLLSIPSIIPAVGWLVSNVLTFLYGVAPAIRYEQIKALAAGKKDVRTPIEVNPAPAV